MKGEIHREIRFKTSFLQSFAKSGRRLIGRYDDGVLGGLPGFEIKIITEVFHCRGK